MFEADNFWTTFSKPLPNSRVSSALLNRAAQWQCRNRTPPLLHADGERPLSMCRRTCSCPTKDPDFIRVRSPPPEQPSPPNFRSVDQLERTSIPALDRRVRGRAVPKPVSWQEEKIPCGKRDSRRLEFPFCCRGVPRPRFVDARL